MEKLVNTEQLEAILFKYLNKSVCVSLPLNSEKTVKISNVGKLCAIPEENDSIPPKFYYIITESTFASISFTIQDIDAIMEETPTSIVVIILK